MASNRLAEIVLANGREVRSIVDRAEGKQLLAMLTQANAHLERKLRAANRRGLGDAWTGHHIAQTRVMVAHSIEQLQAAMNKRIDAVSGELVTAGLKHTLGVLKAGEAQFGNTLTGPLALEQASRFRHATQGIQSSLLRQHATSVDRYGTHMIGAIEKEFRLGIVGNASVSEMIDQLVGRKGPSGSSVSLAAREIAPGKVHRFVVTTSEEGLFVDRRYWAERIVRTELMYSYNRAAQASMQMEHDEDFPDLKRVLVETFDRVTGEDSIYAHGEIRGLDEPFEDGAGRVYLFPPGRPNDRGRVVPWRAEWGPPKGALAPRPAAEREAARDDEAPAASSETPKAKPILPSEKKHDTRAAAAVKAKQDAEIATKTSRPAKPRNPPPIAFRAGEAPIPIEPDHANLATRKFEDLPTRSVGIKREDGHNYDEWTPNGEPASVFVGRSASVSELLKTRPEEEEAIQAFTGSWSSFVRKAQTTGESANEEVAKAALAVERPFADGSLPRVHGRIFRGLDELSRETIDRLMADDVFDQRGTASASRSPAVAARFMDWGSKRKDYRAMLVIHQKSGIAIEGVSLQPEELEVLIGKNARFKILARHRIKEIPRALVIEMTEL